MPGSFHDVHFPLLNGLKPSAPASDYAEQTQNYGGLSLRAGIFCVGVSMLWAAGKLKSKQKTYLR